MNRKKKTASASPAKVRKSTPSAGQSLKASRDYSWLVTLLGFFAVWTLFSWVYGDVLWRIEQDSYVTANAAMMKPLTDLSPGWVFYAGRWLVTLMKFPWFGGLLLALLLTACAELLSEALRLPIRWKWTAYLLPMALFGWLVWRGFNIFYRSEPSWLVILPTLVCAVLCIAVLARRVGDKRAPVLTAKAQRILMGLVALLFLACAVCSFLHLSFPVAAWLLVFFFIYAFAAVLLVTGKQASEGRKLSLFSLGNLLLPVLALAAGITASQVNDSVIATARMQRLLEQQDWESMCETALDLPRPTRSVAAYYALALEQQGALLEGIFDLPFDFPKVSFDADMASDEYALFASDCNLAAGLPNSAYHEAFEQTVMSGQRLHTLKTMAKAALLNGEERLVRKYLGIIGANPFEQDFCDRLMPMLADTTLIESDGEFAHIRTLASRDKHPFEQNFRKPVFLGYNMGLAEGPDPVLRTSAAACLYSKDLEAFIPRAQVFVAKGWPLPECMQQALVIYSIKHGGADFLKQFQGKISPMTEQTIAAFSREVAPIAKDKDAMRRELKKDWLGTYVYYYYCENNNPDQVRKRESAGVN